MKEMRRVLALLLCAVMLVGYVPAGAFAAEVETTAPSVVEETPVTEAAAAAAETTEAAEIEFDMGSIAVEAADADDGTDYLFIATDRHANTSVIGNIINNMESAIGENELDYLGLGGDMVGSGSTHPAYNSSTVLAEVTGATSSLDAANVDIVAGIHDMKVNDDAGIVLPYQGGGAEIYEGDRFYVYGVEEYCISEDSNASNWSAEAQKFVSWANGSGIDKSKAIIVLSHYPLHQRRGDNAGAAYWADALNTVAAGDDATIDRNVVFFWGHNHTGEGSADTTVYHVAPGGSISVEGGSSSQTIYFTYANAGYLNAKSSATLVSITDSTITFDKYVNSSVSTTYSVERVQEEAELLYIDVAGQQNYTVGDELDVTVTACYSDGSAKDVTAEAEMTGYDLGVSGEQVVNVTYGGQTVTYGIAVRVSAAQTNGDILSSGTAGLTGLTAVWNDVDLSETLDEQAYSAYDIVLEGYTGGQVTVTLDVGYVDASAAELYYVNADGSLTEITEFTAEATEYGAIVTFTAQSGSFTVAVGNPAPGADIPEDAVLTELRIVEPEKKYYFLSVDTENDGSVYLNITGLEVTAVYNDGEYTKTLDWDRFGEVADGYSLSFGDLSTKGEKTITVAYGGVSGEFKVWACEDVLSFEDVNAAVSFDTPSVVGLTVETAEVTEVITAAVEGLLEGEVTVYSFTAQYAAGETALQGTASITLPIPEGVTNPAVYYVSPEGETEYMPTVNNGDGTLTFVTGHFSDFVVGEAGKETTVQRDPTTQTVTDGTSSKTIYVLADGVKAGKKYILVSKNTAGSAYALKENTTSGSGVTVNAGDTSTGGKLWIETEDKSIIWNYDSNSRFKSENGSYYLRYSSGLSFSTSNYTSWTVGDDNMYVYSSNRYRYVYNDNGTWTTSSSWSTSSSYKIYFYEEYTQTIEANGTYSINGEPAAVSKVVPSEGTTTVTLGSKLTFVPKTPGAAATSKDVSTTASYSIETDPAGIIKGISGNTVTFNNGVYGTALVKVTYTGTYTNSTGGTSSYTVTNYITVEAKAPYKAVEVYKTSDETTAVTSVPVKGVTASSTVELTAALLEYAGGETPNEDSNAELTWSVLSDESGILDAYAFTANGTSGETAVTKNSNVTLNFSGVGGIATIRVQAADGTFQNVTVTAAVTDYYVPEDGTNDFPDYPDEGAVVIDKTATAVGDFNKTGIAQVELSMFGVPVSAAEPVDVVLVVDLSSSMQDSKNNNANRFTYAKAASKAFVTGLATNPENRLAIVSFNSNSGSGTTNLSMRYLTAENVTAANTAIDGYSTATGTNYIAGLNTTNSILTSTKIEGRKQFVVFLSDGAPTRYRTVDSTSDSTYESFANGGESTEEWISNGSRDSSQWKYEYYTTAMKLRGVTVYTVGLGLSSSDYQPQYLLNDMSGPAGETSAENDTGTAKSKLNKYYFEVADSKSADALSSVFAQIATEINAASNVEVNDLISEYYSLVFTLPEGVSAADTNNQEFFIEVVNYALDANHDRTGASESLMRVYLESGTFKAYTVSTTAAGVETKNAVTAAYTEVKEGEKGYFKASGSGYVYVADGSGTHNLTAGIHAEGIGSDGSLDNLILVTPYFTYIGKDQDLTWTTDKLGQKNQIAIRYFVYLNNSAGSVGDANQLEPGVYQTNVKATVTYTNHLGNKCQQTFPVPQMTWSGAQVGVTFYLVNALGQPINRNGVVVPLSAAAFVTETFYESVIWNTELEDPLRAQILAADHLPEGYTLYDPAAEYMVHVYKNEQDVIYDNFFKISGSAAGAEVGPEGNTHLVKNTGTTYVYNTINSPNKYNTYGVYSSVKAVGQNVTYQLEDGTVENEAVTYNTGNDIDYSSTNVAFAVLWIPTLAEDTIVVDYGLPVAINVVNNDQLVNTVNSLGTTVTNKTVAMNTGHTSAGSPIGCKTGTSYEGNVLTLENGDKVYNYDGLLYYVQNDMQFNLPSEFYYDTNASFVQENVEIKGYMYSKVSVIPATTVYYEDTFLTLNAYEAEYKQIECTDDNKSTTFYTKESDNSYTRVTKPVVGQTYYYVEWPNTPNASWTTVPGSTDGGTPTANVVQGTDRPGEDRYHLPGYDGDNPYGYDPVYSNYTEHSLNSAKKITVNETTRGEATFTFYGTGFDVISTTSNDTGTLIVQVFEGDKAEGTAVKTLMVDTYYSYAYLPHKVTMTYTAENGWVEGTVEKVETMGTDESIPEEPGEGATYTYYEYRWVSTANDPNALYQVPVMKISGLSYKQYTAKIIASYGEIFDHGDAGSYDLYLDAIRIYDPTGNQSETANNAYVKDNEGWPAYEEIRNNIIKASGVTVVNNGDGTFTVTPEETKLGRAIFIDSNDATVSVKDYVNFGPNNEVYLAQGQSVMFTVPLSANVADIQIGMKSATKTPAKVTMTIMQGTNTVYSSTGSVAAETTTDLYYSIGGNIKDRTQNASITLTNSGDKATVASITNLKLTFKTDPGAAAIDLPTISNEEAAAVINMLYARYAEPEVKAEAELEVAVREKSVKAGKNVSLQATTSEDVAYLTVNGQKITRYTENKTTGKRTWSVSLKAEEAGALDITVTAYSADGEELETVTETVTVTAKNNGAVQQIVGQLIGMLGR